MLISKQAALDFSVLTEAEVNEQFPGAIAQLAVQRKGPSKQRWVKISGVGEGGWLFGKDSTGTLCLFNSILHGVPLGDSVYRLIYTWNGEWDIR